MLTLIIEETEKKKSDISELRVISPMNSKITTKSIFVEVASMMRI